MSIQNVNSLQQQEVELAASSPTSNLNSDAGQTGETNAEASALDRLAERCGIQHVSEDAFGKEHVTSAETKRALLEAMRFPASSDDEAEAALHELEREEWSKALPPVLVAYRQEGQRIAVPIVLDRTATDVCWHLTLEDNQELSGTVPAAELPFSGSGQNGRNEVDRRTLLLPPDLPYGYHSLGLDGHTGECSLIVTPGECWLPSDASDRNLWGIAAQLYLLPSERNWGMGDFTDLQALLRLCSENGADVLGLNPLHAMFPDSPGEASPYSPSDRLLLNILYIDVEAVPELASSEEARSLLSSAEFKQKLEKSRNEPLVDYEAVASLKLQILQVLFSTFQTTCDQTRVAAFEAFHQERRNLLDRACTFQALRAHFAKEGTGTPDCNDWPHDLRSSNSPGVPRFREEHPDLIRFQLWLQWIADDQLHAAKNAAGNMAIGLYRDLAVGAHPSGAEVWSFPESLVSEASIGAPPDIWNPAGQNWALPPLHPIAARRCAYRSFVELLQANMRYAGALRIDHALALQRLYWIPKGKEPKDGAFVQNPTEDLVGILALESHRNRCMVIGEDLGTVPKGFRERMARAKILSYRVLFFERDEKCFLPPQSYPALSLSVASSHDLPTVRGWWEEDDIDLKERLGLFPEADGASKARKTRSEDREALLDRLVHEGLLPSSENVDYSTLTNAVHRFLHTTHSLLTLVQLDDLTGEQTQVNVPATSDENPNWRRKLRLSLEDLEQQNVIASAAALMS